MYRRPRFLDILLEVRRSMAHEANYDVIAFAQMARSGSDHALARNQPVTRVVTGESNNPLRAKRAKTGKRTSARK